MTVSARTKRWLVSLGMFVLFALLAAALVYWLPLAPSDRTLVIAGLLVLGLGAAALAWHLLRPADEAAGRTVDESVLVVRHAMARLPRGALLAKPMVILVGPATSAKSTLIAQSGLDAELLAGDAVGTGIEAPTAAANVWLTREGVAVEAAGALIADGDRFRTLMRALRGNGLLEAVGRAEPSPRAMVVCVPSDYLAGGTEMSAQLDALALLVRQRLADAAQSLGMSIPTYVLFTRADRLPHFDSWVSPLAGQEVVLPLGAALPFDANPGQAHTERLTPVLERAFSSLVASVASRRSELLGRESVLGRRLTAYEFPRELGKLAPAAIRFLLEISRPSQLGPSPQLRGFWFTGVRPTVLREGPRVADIAAEAASAPVGATAVLNADAVRKAMQAAKVGATVRTVPQWVFLERFFSDVIFGDEAARSAARGGVRVSGLRRALLVSAIAAGLLLVLGVGISWGRNRALTARTLQVARALNALPGAGTTATPGDPSSIAALQQLDSLRALLDSVATLDADGPPLLMRFGLWNGKRLLEDARPIWVAAYRQQLHESAWRALKDSLSTLPPDPQSGSNYSVVYDMLRTYLVGTTEAPRSAARFVTPTLFRLWAHGDATPDSLSAALARRQFDAYATWQASGALWPERTDAELITRARTHLNGFAGIDPIYMAMRAEVEAHASPIVLADSLPPGGAVSTGGAVVAAPFTLAGWQQMQAIFRDADRFFQGERWVVGERSAVASRNRATELAEIRARYIADYTAEWRHALELLSVPRAGSFSDASARLGRLGGPRSPLLTAFALLARQTSADSAIGKAFQPVHVITPPGVTDKLIGESNQPYADALLGLQVAMEQMASMPSANDSASVQALKDAATAANAPAEQAQLAARRAAQQFAIEGDAAVTGMAVSRLLESPVNSAVSLLRVVQARRVPQGKPAVAAGGGGGGGGGGAPPAGGGGGGGGGGGAPPPVPEPAGPSVTGVALATILNDKGRDLCRDMEKVLRRFPFNPDGGDADINDVTRTLAPGTGSLWRFYDDRLIPLMPRQGSQYVARAAYGVTLSPSFVQFFNRMASISTRLFGPNGASPRVAMTVRGSVEGEGAVASLVHGDRTLRFSGDTPPAQLVWPATGRNEARLRVAAGGKEREVAKGDGPWALFRLVARAQSWTDRSGESGRATFGGANPVVLDFTTPGAGNVLSRGALAGMACVPQVAQ